MLKRTFLAFVFIVVTRPIYGQTDIQTLGDFDARYVGQRAVVMGIAENGVIAFHFAKRTPSGGWGAISDADIPSSYRGVHGVVLAASLRGQEGIGESATNAFNEAASENSTTNLSVLFQADDGTLLTTNPIPFTADLYFELEIDHQARVDEIKRNLDGLIGTDLYAIAGSAIWLRDIDTPLNELTEGRPIDAPHRLQNVPRLRPLRIVKYQYLEAPNILLLKLRFPDSSSAICVLPDVLMFHPEESFEPFVERILEGKLWTEPFIMERLTAREIHAIQNGTIFVGMSWATLGAAIPIDFESSDLLKERSGRLTIYLDRTLHVTGWKSAPRPPVTHRLK